MNKLKNKIIFDLVITIGMLVTAAIAIATSQTIYAVSAIIIIALNFWSD